MRLEAILQRLAEIERTEGKNLCLRVFPDGSGWIGNEDDCCDFYEFCTLDNLGFWLRASDADRKIQAKRQREGIDSVLGHMSRLLQKCMG